MQKNHEKGVIMSGGFNMSFDPKVRQEFTNVLSGHGLTVPQAFKLFANQATKTKTAPLSFDWQTSDELCERVSVALNANKQKQTGKLVCDADFDEMTTGLANER